MELICSVSLMAKRIGILEDEDDDEHEDGSSNSEFRLNMGWQYPKIWQKFDHAADGD